MSRSNTTLHPKGALSPADALCPPAEFTARAAGGGGAGLGELEPPMDGQSAALAHDLRSHLNAILLSAEAARLGVRSGRQVEFGPLLGRIERNVRMAMDLIASQALQVQPQPAACAMAAVRLDQLARETADAMQPILERAGVHVHVQADEGVSVHADRSRLGRVISNLLDNAIRHSPKDSSIEIVVSQHGSTAVCQVADRGPGVPAQDRRRIFEQHVQGSGIPGAAGLGLFIARRVVEAYDGRIWVEDHPPQGARFVVSLPVERRGPERPFRR